jgi:hypothetical protein
MREKRYETRTVEFKRELQIAIATQGVTRWQAEQPVRWYELRVHGAGATLKKTSRRWRLRKDSGDSGASERSAERQTNSEEEFESIRCRIRNCVWGPAQP